MDNVLRPFPLAAAALLATLAALPAAAQDLPLVSRQLQFHGSPGVGGGAASGQPARLVVPAAPPGTTAVPVVIANIPAAPLPPGAAILPPRIVPATGLYVEGFDESAAELIPETPAQLPDEAMPPLVVGQIYLPPWWDRVRNVRGGSGPADPGPVERGVEPEDLRISPVPSPALPGSDLPAEPPAAPLQRGAAPQDMVQETVPQPAAGPAPLPLTAIPEPVAAQPVAAQPVAAQPAATQPAALRPAAQSRLTEPAPGSAPFPLVSRKLNFQY